jgi:hypothetical protein
MLPVDTNFNRVQAGSIDAGYCIMFEPDFISVIHNGLSIYMYWVREEDGSVHLRVVQGDGAGYLWMERKS